MTPSADGARGPLIPFAEGVWLASEPVRFVGLRLTVNMVVLRVGDTGLLLFSPVRMSPERRAAVEALGSVEHLYAPNTHHHQWMSEWAAAFPSARIHGPSELSRKRPDLRIDRAHNVVPEPAFENIVEEHHIDGFRLEETVLFHRSARTLVVADLVHNIGRPTHGWTAFYTRVMGFYDRVALSRAIRAAAFSDHVAARQSIETLLELPIERLIVGHGDPLTQEARESLRGAYSWLVGRQRE